MSTQDEKRIAAQQAIQKGNDYLGAARESFRKADDLLGAIGPINPIPNGASTQPPIDLGEPGRPAPIPPPELGLNFTEKRITDNAALGKIRAHGYSKRQAWNSDESLIHLPGGDWRIVDNDGEVKFGAPVSSEYNWHPTEPFFMYGIRDRQHFGLADIRDGSFEVMYSDRNLRLGSNEGNLDASGRYVPLDNDSHAMVYDIQRGEIIGKALKEAHYNWHGMSHTGEFAMVGNALTGSDLPRQKKIYDSKMQLIHTIYGSEHGDFALIDGVDWYVELGRVPRAIRLSDGHIEALGRDPSWTWGHFSGRGPEGKIFYSVHQGRHNGWSDFSIGEFDIVSGLSSNIEWGVIDQTGSTDYEDQMKLSVSPSGRRVIYTSDREGGVPNEYVMTRS